LSQYFEINKENRCKL